MATSIIPSSTVERSWLKFYNLSEFLGSGSYGGVYKAEHKFTKELCAVKITYLQKQSIGNNSDTEQAREKMRREFLLPFDKEHKNIVNVYEGLETKGNENEVTQVLKSVTNFENREAKRIKSKLEFWAGENGLDALFISMELCGITLRQWITTSTLIENELWDAQESIIRGIVNGLTFLHKNKILHRDLKSENIFFALGSIKHQVKIGDFGIGRIIHTDESKTSAQTLKPVTTPLYRAPELESENAEYTLQADLFSLGLIIYEVLKMLKSRKQEFAVIQHRTSNLELPIKPFANAFEMVLGLTETDTNKRFRTVEELNLKELSKITGQRNQRLLSSTVTLERRRYSAKEFLQIVNNYVSIIGHPEGGTAVEGIVDFLYDNRVIQNIVFRSDVNITGNGNEFSNILFHCEGHEYWGAHEIKVSGSYNVIKKIKMFTPSQVTVEIEGDSNTIADVPFEEDLNRHYTYYMGSIWLKSGTRHIVKNILHHKYTITLDDVTSSCRVENCHFVLDSFVSGLNHIFKDCELYNIAISGDGHKFTKCGGSVRNDSATRCEFIECSRSFPISSVMFADLYSDSYPFY